MAAYTVERGGSCGFGPVQKAGGDTTAILELNPDPSLAVPSRPSTRTYSFAREAELV